MKIALINPDYRYKAYRASTDYVYLGGIAYVSACLKAQGHDVVHIDFKHDESASLESAADCDVIGISTYINSYAFLKDALPKLKGNGKIVVVGGPLVSSYGMDSNNLLMNEFPEIDYAVIGEGEKTICGLVRRIEDGSTSIPRGVVFRKGDLIGATQGSPDIVTDLDSLPAIPYLDWKGFVRNAKHQTLTVQTSRGCYNACSFCFTGMHPGVRSFSLPRIEQDLETAVRLMEPRQLNFEDQSFTYDFLRAEQITRIVLSTAKNLGLDLGYYIQARVSDINPDLARALEETGCAGVKLGVESFDKEILRRAGKNITPEQIYSAVNTVRNAGMKAIGFIIVGLPGENRRTLDATIDAVRCTGMIARPRVLIPLPGTAIYDKAVREGMIDEVELLRLLSTPECFDTTEGSWVPVNMSDGLTDQELLDARDEINRLGETFER
ncbi:MAG: radical SAM protein [Candidatus Woesearchaeota archaeon]